KTRNSAGRGISQFDLTGRIAVVTGGSGALGSPFAHALGAAGATGGGPAPDADPGGRTGAGGGSKAVPLSADVRERPQLERARDAVLERYERIDVLVNAAGGNVPEATLDEGRTFFDLPADALRKVFELNVFGTILACQVFGAAMVPRSASDEESRSIVNVSSMAAQRALTRVAGYGSAKAAVD